ncbi:MAG: outer membrane protein assembly factor BamE [Magnetospirillum sp.]|nr:outer membrane protein assembly factor BamE [Magnetospirillum sp.]
MKNLSRSHYSLIALVMGAAVVACSPIVEVRGNLPPADALAQVKIGSSTRDDIQALLGTPSNVTPFGEESWHYISSITEREAFFEPVIKDRKVITVVFDRTGVVRALDTRGMEESRDVIPVDRETSTAGKELTILQQLMGNVGRFSKPSGK